MMTGSDAPPARHGNLLAITAMMGSMALFVANDTCVKLAGSTVPLGEVIVTRNSAATVYILIYAALFGGLALPVRPPLRLLTWRMFAEASSTLFFLSALFAMPIADANAIAQFTPLAMTAAAAIFLKEPVGWRRWLAAAAGLAGVLLVARPGSSAFNPAALLVIGAIAMVVVRDLLTRRISGAVPTLTLTLMSAAAVAPSGLLLLPFETWVWMTPREVALLLAAGAFLTLAYALIIVAMRTGEVGATAPYRYSVIPFALFSGWIVWGDTPDRVQALGILIIVVAGLFSAYRERLALRA